MPRAPFLIALALGLTLAAPAHAASSGGRGGVDAEIFLVKDKVWLGGGFSYFPGTFGFDGAFSFIWLTSDAPERGVDGTFVGSQLGLHVAARLDITRGAHVRIATGVDAYPLYGINADEWKLAWPLIAEARVFVTRTLNVFIRPRYYILSSDGLEPGRAYEGDETVPFLVSIGFGGEWK
ncbi:MAG: hypothetical protein KC620_07815 [Myxococcales bacterium]|nr:hypothetical protein [Myxococcales bacterium]